MAVNIILASSFVLLFSFYGQTEGHDCAYPVNNNSTDSNDLSKRSTPPLLCKKNEIYDKCYLPSCENTCSDIFKSEMCDYKGCKPGCKCAEGFVRDKKNNCIPVRDCFVCKLNEVYTVCYQRNCEKSCQNPEIVGGCTLERCSPGCKCDEGLVRDENNVCIFPEQCKHDGCCSNEYYSRCGTCERQCNNVDALSCDRACGPAACLCRIGYARNDFGQCVPMDNCKLIRPRSCKRNEVRSCKVCEATCGNPLAKCTLIKCHFGCFCRDGYVRNCLGECIPKEMCDFEKKSE